MMRVAVFASGGGTNLQAILDHQSAMGAAASARVVLVASDHREAGALTRARDAGINAVALKLADRTTGLLSILADHRVELVVLAGYLRLIPADVVSTYRGHILNVHPALLPAYGGAGMYGHRVHEAVVAAKERLTGLTVHFVDEHYDQGPIIAQWPLRVLPTDTPDDVARHVQELEHLLYPRVVDAVAAGRIRLDGRNKVVCDDGIDLQHFTPPRDRSDAHKQIETSFRALMQN